MTFDGIILHTAPDAGGKVSSYEHFFRNGILEAVTASLLETFQVPGQRLIPHVSFEESVLEYLPRCFQSLQQIGVTPPLSISLTLRGVRGLSMAMGIFSRDRGNEIREEILIIPGAIVEDFSKSASRILKPMFDRVWNACGLLGSENFDAQGNWSPRRSF